MNRYRLKAGIAMLLMLTAVGLSYALRPTEHLSDERPRASLEELFPKSFGGWVMDNSQPAQLISPDIAAVLKSIYNDTLSRTYVNQNGERIMLSVAYGGDQSDATRAHRPEVCYPAQGFQILSNETARIVLTDTALPVRRLVAQMGSRIEPITYWIVVGDQIAVSGPEQKLAQLRYGLRGIVPDGMLVRVSSIASSAPLAYAVHDLFVTALSAAIAKDLQSRVIGSPSDRF